MKKWNWGILGQGAIAVQMAEALMKEHGTIYAVAGRHMEKVTAFASAYTVEHCYDIESLLADEQVDIIYIATPHTYHYDYMMRALQHGKHVLCPAACRRSPFGYRYLCVILCALVSACTA